LTAVYLKNVLNLPENKKVFVIGMDGIKEELSLLNIEHFSLPDDHPVDDEALSKLGPNQDVNNFPQVKFYIDLIFIGWCFSYWYG
jgi:ribonucleotide monophosphatase NagD (HAD superfamily)